MPQDREAKRFAEEAYSAKDGGLLSKFVKDYDPSGRTGRYGSWGFSATLSYSEQTEIHYLAFPGTRSFFADFKGACWDWIADLLQLSGLPSSQFDQGARLTAELKTALGPNARLLLTGHSKGGAQAGASSFATRVPAIVFNPASLSPVYQQGTSGTIRSHVTLGDPLSVLRTVGANVEQTMLQANRSAPGHIIVHPPLMWDTHSLGNFPD